MAFYFFSSRVDFRWYNEGLILEKGIKMFSFAEKIGLSILAIEGAIGTAVAILCYKEASRISKKNKK